MSREQLAYRMKAARLSFTGYMALTVFTLLAMAYLNAGDHTQAVGLFGFEFTAAETIILAPQVALVPTIVVAAHAHELLAAARREPASTTLEVARDVPWVMTSLLSPPCVFESFSLGAALVATRFTVRITDGYWSFTGAVGMLSLVCLAYALVAIGWYRCLARDALSAERSSA